jgi:hypothetical protein
MLLPQVVASVNTDGPPCKDPRRNSLGRRVGWFWCDAVAPLSVELMLSDREGIDLLLRVLDADRVGAGRCRVRRGR